MAKIEKQPKLGIRHYLSKRISPIEDYNGEKQYAVYVQITYKKKSINIKSQICGYVAENKPISNENILQDSKIIKKAINETDFEKFTFVNFLDRYNLYCSDIEKLLRDYFDEVIYKTFIETPDYGSAENPNIFKGAMTGSLDYLDIDYDFFINSYKFRINENIENISFKNIIIFLRAINIFQARLLVYNWLYEKSYKEFYLDKLYHFFTKNPSVVESFEKLIDLLIEKRKI